MKLGLVTIMMLVLVFFGCVSSEDATVTTGTPRTFPLVLERSVPASRVLDLKFLEVEETALRAYKQRGEDILTWGDIRSSDPFHRAMAEYWSTYWSSPIDSRLKGEPINGSKWTRDQRQYVLRNTYTEPVSLVLLSGLSSDLQNRLLDSAKARWMHTEGMGRPELSDKILKVWTNGEYEP